MINHKKREEEKAMKDGPLIRRGRCLTPEQELSTNPTRKS